MNSERDLSAIKGELINLMKEKFCISTNKLNNIYDKNLLSSDVGLKARDLLVLYMNIEKVFGIKIAEEIVMEEKFNTIDSIADYIFNAYM